MPNLSQITESAKVTSPQGCTNWRDRLWAAVCGFVSAIGTFLVAAWSVVSEILNSVTEHVLPFLNTIPREDKPFWISGLVFLAMGLLMLHRRKTASPSAGPFAEHPVQPPPPPPPPPPADHNNSGSAF